MDRYKLKFNQNDLSVPPILVDEEDRDYSKSTFPPKPVRQGGYIIGEPQDPGWHKYPKDQYSGLSLRLPRNYAVTDYVWDKDHYAYYIPYNELSNKYSEMLRDVFEQVKRSSKSAIKEYITKQEIKSRIKQINSQKDVSKKKIEALEEAMKKYKTDMDRAIRKDKKNDNIMTDDELREKYFEKNPIIKTRNINIPTIRVVELGPTLATEQKNIESNDKELKRLKNMLK